MGFLGLLPRYSLSADTPLARLTRLAAVVGRASFVSYIAQQWLIDFVPIWVGFDSWLTPWTCPLYLAITTTIMYWLAHWWAEHRANRYMTLGLKPGLHWADGRAGLFATVVLAVMFLNALALLNAPRLTPGKLALVPAARHHS